jgi:hypothetical protein
LETNDIKILLKLSQPYKDINITLLRMPPLIKMKILAFIQKEYYSLKRLVQADIYGRKRRFA